eukprot:403341654
MMTLIYSIRDELSDSRKHLEKKFKGLLAFSLDKQLDDLKQRVTGLGTYTRKAISQGGAGTGFVLVGKRQINNRQFRLRQINLMKQQQIQMMASGLEDEVNSDSLLGSNNARLKSNNLIDNQERDSIRTIQHQKSNSNAKSVKFNL